MKLSTRLILVVTAVLTIFSFISGSFAIYNSQQTQLDSFKKILMNFNEELKTSQEDNLSTSLLLAEQSSVPITLIYFGNSNQISYLTDAAGEIKILPTEAKIITGLKHPITSKDMVESFYQIDDNFYLGFYISTKPIHDNTNSTWKSILIFNFLLILLSIILISFLFRRDSKINAQAERIREFIGDASHELKTPLTVIRGYSELLSQENEYAKKINQESLRMAQIIDQLLTMAALDENKIDLPENIELKDFLTNKLEDFRILQPNRKIEFYGSDFSINASRNLMEILFNNILSNVRTHTSVAAPLRVSIIRNNVTIEDGGPGLSQIPDKPFQRFDTSRSRETGGSGLGMSLIQRSAKALDAKLLFGKSDLGGLKISITF